MKKVLITVLITLSGVTAFSQHSSIAYETLADSLFAHHHYQDATEFYQKAFKKSPHPGDIMLQLAKCYYKMNLIAESEKWFVKAKQNRGSFTAQDYYEFARVLTILKKKDQADTLLEHVLENDPDNIIARKALDDLRNFQKYYQDSAAVSIQSLSVNTTASEFAPVYYQDGIVFASSRQDGPFTKKSHWDDSPFLNLYHAVKSGNQQFTAATLFEDDLDTRHHDGPAAFYSQYQKMIINRNQRIEVNGRKNVFEWRPGLYDAKFDKTKSSWEVTPLPFNNPSHSYLHPFISEDGTVLYFASDKPGGYGGTDIYRVVQSNGLWGTPINLGPVVNTTEDEAFPFLIDNTLYFTSDGHGGLGGLDIFRSEQTANEFTPPANLGYPINSTADDFSLVSAPDQRSGYFASSRGGNDDLFSFQKLSVNHVLAMGVVKNVSDELVDGFRATVTNKETGSDIPVQSGKGTLTFIGDKGETYDVVVGHENYETSFEEVTIPSVGPETEKFTIVLKDRSENSKLLMVDTDKGTTKMYVKTGESLNEITEKDDLLFLTTPKGSEYLGKGNISKLRTDPSSVLKELGMKKTDRSNLRNIYFDFDKANLDNEDITYLNEVKNILEHDGALKLVIAGHADDRGEESYNVELSKRRVEAVHKYLISHGILKNRIIQQAHGESLPVVPCYEMDCSEDDHQKNRRAEFVLKYDNAPSQSPASSTKTTKGGSSAQR
ncbi:MAG TPA: OmpA family protein [Chryseolinea sp.]|jgi:outer membrane protein OmpA-like peptidoglycan-associated protein/tetratricopeptide (TPR) repeat protein|nr:OmpA family protein [Chryseolinea sp.]